MTDTDQDRGARELFGSLVLVPEGAQDAVRAAVAGAFAGRSWNQPGILETAPSGRARHPF